jgi:hypothetical protein
MSRNTIQVLPQRRSGRAHAVRLAPALLCVGLFALSVYFSRDVAGGDPVVTNAVAKVNAFLESLDGPQRGKALFEFDSAKKPSWSNLPVTMVPRNGLRLGELTKAQRAAALDALAAVLSKQGYQKAIDIMNADDQLVKGNNKNQFGTENYYLAVFGKPSATKPWTVQFGGHHLGINVTIVGKESVLTPTHTGVQPDSFARDGKTVRPLGPENDLAFKLVNMLDAEQQRQAVLGVKPKGELLVGPGKDGKTITPEGLKCASLKDVQRATLMDLIGAWVNILPDDAAAKRMAALKAKIDDTYFAWYGPTTNGSPAYYRIQGPTLLIEYAPQGGTNHIHTIIRDPSNDYGKELTRS